ncbi:MAG: (d)CMP kinase [Oscillospiraceae bacterium]|nr:(d)CMP kinase [Oscillospiraceae bacterium]
MALSIAVDGPVGAGKSTAARELARRLGILHLDTGAMYRAVGLAALEAGVNLDDMRAIERVNESTDVSVTFEDGTQRTWLNGRDVSGVVRTPLASMAASMVSTVGGVRAVMVKRQRAIACQMGAVLDGRDIGTRVLPDAQFKFYLTASPEIRAKRRMDELRAKGDMQPFERVLTDVIERDLRDSTREIDPLRPASDAIIIDTSDMTLDEEVERMMEIMGPNVYYE